MSLILVGFEEKVGRCMALLTYFAGRLAERTESQVL